MSSRRSALLTAAIFVAIAIPVSAIRPLWLDEILQLLETRQTSTIRMISAVRESAGAVPLGYLVQWGGLKITGYSLVFARLPSALFGAGAVFFVALLGSELGLKRGWLAAVIFGLFPLMLRYAGESRVYSQALFLSILATYLYVRLAKNPTGGLATGYWLVLTAAAYTQPYSACVGLAHLLDSVIRRARKAALYCGAAVALAMLAFLPWFLWVREGWSRSATISGVHFAVSLKTPLMLFRELTGAGYWGSGLVLLLCAGALAGMRAEGRDRLLPVLVIATVLASVLTGDAWFGYFIAARQFLWLLPAVAILVAAAIERYPRAGLATAVLLMIVCIRQSFIFYRSPGEDWQTAANVLAEQVRRGDCLMVAPAAHITLYRFFQPGLGPGPCPGGRVVLAMTPAASTTERRSAIDHLISSGYEKVNEKAVGRSEIIWFRRSR